MSCWAKVIQAQQVSPIFPRSPLSLRKNQLEGAMERLTTQTPTRPPKFISVSHCRPLGGRVFDTKFISNRLDHHSPKEKPNIFGLFFFSFPNVVKENIGFEQTPVARHDASVTQSVVLYMFFTICKIEKHTNNHRPLECSTNIPLPPFFLLLCNHDRKEPRDVSLFYFGWFRLSRGIGFIIVAL